MMVSQKIIYSPSPPSPTPGTILFETDRLRIRRYLLSDASALIEAANHPELYANDETSSPYTLEEAKVYVRSCLCLENPCIPNLHLYPRRTGIFLKPYVASNPDYLLIGSMGMLPSYEDINYRTWKLKIWLTPASWGMGYASEAVSAFVRWSFMFWPMLNRIQSSVFDIDDVGERVLVKCGFSREGIKRGSAVKFGTFYDEAMYACIRSDFEKGSEVKIEAGVSNKRKVRNAPGVKIGPRVKELGVKIEPRVMQ